jgi:hypothetical protein
MSRHMNGGINDSVFLDSVTEPLRERIAELEATVDRVQTLYSIGEVCRTGLEAECHRLEAQVKAAEIQINAMHRGNIESQERLAAALSKSHKETETDMLALANLRNFIP